MFLFHTEQRNYIQSRMVTLPYLSPDERGKGFAATPRQVPSGWQEATIQYGAMNNDVPVHCITCTLM
jgi:hypothetical protein